jgi:peptidase M28-like protein
VSEEAIRDDVAAICDFDGRLAGTDAERRASKHVAARLESTGRRASVESAYVQPQWAVVHFLHCAIAAIGSMIAAKEPAIGFAMVLVAATSAYLDLNARHYVLRRLPFRRASQNVHTLSAGSQAEPIVVLCANVDAPRTGAGYNQLPSRLQELAARSGFPVVSAPTRLWFWSIALLLPPLGARMAGFEPDWLAALQLPQTLLLIVACFLLGEIALSPASPGANTNASGVAALLDALRRLDAEPPANLRVEAVVCGAGETSMQGMRSFVRAHRGDLDRASIWFVSLESVGRGEPRWVVSQGPAVSVPMDRELSELCAALAEADEGRAEPMRDGRTSAAYIARAYKFRALPVTCREPGRALPEDFHTPKDTPDGVDPAAIAAAASLTADLVRLLDRDVGRRKAKPASEPEPSAARPA